MEKDWTKKEKPTEKTMEVDHYANGADTVCDQMIKFCQNQIERIKLSDTKPNSTRQMIERGMFVTYHRMIAKLNVKKNTIKSKRKDTK